MDLFDGLGFQWDRKAVPETVPRHSIQRVCFRFHKMLPEFVWDASVLEGNPFTFPEVKTLLDGITVGGRKVSDQEQILNLAASSKRLLKMTKENQFTLQKSTLLDLHRLVARNEALEWGMFRGEGDEIHYTPDVGLGSHGRYTSLPTIKGAPVLNKIFEDGVMALQENCLPFERAIGYFLFGALQQFFFDGNKRTSRFMMNGILMSNGIDAISVPAAKVQEFNEKMVSFYLTKNATDMFSFMIGCHPDFEQKITEQCAHPEISAEKQRRIDGILTLKYTAGAAYTFHLRALEAIVAADGNALNVSWREVEDATINDSIAKHGQQVQDVYQILCDHSPGISSLEDRVHLQDRIVNMAPSLQEMYRITLTTTSLKPK